MHRNNRRGGSYYLRAIHGLAGVFASLVALLWGHVKDVMDQGMEIVEDRYAG